MKTTRPILPTPASPITTRRLLLRPKHTDDLAGYRILRSQIEVMMWTTAGKVDADEAATQAWLDRFLPPNNSKTYSFSVEELAHPGTIIGTLGCHRFQPVPEIGYMFRKEFWGKGYASEAMTAWIAAWWDLPRREVEILTERDRDQDHDHDEGQETSTDEIKRRPIGSCDQGHVPEVLLACTVETNLASQKVLHRLGFLPVAEEMIDDHQRPGDKIKLTEYHLQRPQS